MLILTRRVGETIMIGDEVTFTVLGVRGNQVRLGISAPAHVSVHREEIYQRIQQERALVRTTDIRNDKVQLIKPSVGKHLAEHLAREAARLAKE